jgi:hypothetical protein
MKEIILWLPQKQTVNGVYYADTYSSFKECYLEKKTHVLEESVVSTSRQCMTTYCT